MARSDVEILISGDSRKLEKAFDAAGDSAKAMAKDLDKSEAQAKSFGKAMDRAGEATDAQEGKFMGAADLLDGLGGAFGLPTEGATNMMRSFGDLSGGFAKIGPLIGQVGGSLGSLMSPTTLIIGGIALLAAGIVALYKNSETFRDIVSAAFSAVKAVVGPIIDGIGKAVSWVTGLFHKGGKETEEMGEAMKAALEKSQARWDSWKTNVTTNLNDIINPLHKARDDSKVSLADINTNLADNQNFYSGWINNLNQLTSRGFGELATYLYSLGPTAERAVGDAQKMTDPQLEKMQTSIHNRLDAAGKSAGQALMNGIGGQNYEQTGVDIGQKVASGLEKVFAPGTLGAQLITKGGLLGSPTIGASGGVTFGRRAGGGPVSAGSAYLVGERGPEMFVPGVGGTVVPNAGGNVTVVVEGNVVTERQLIDAIHNGLLAKQKRGPSLGLT